jgi:hypothetical protein
MDIKVLFFGLKQPACEADHLHLVPILRMHGALTPCLINTNSMVPDYRQFYLHLILVIISKLKTQVTVNKVQDT